VAVACLEQGRDILFTFSRNFLCKKKFLSAVIFLFDFFLDVVCQFFGNGCNNVDLDIYFQDKQILWRQNVANMWQRRKENE